MTHQSMTSVSPNSTFKSQRVSQTPPTADLFRTRVDQGLGTSPDDPYVRTLPNMESRPPESTVLQSTAATAPTLDECAALQRKCGSMRYWIGDVHPRLPYYARQLLVSNALPVSPAAEKLLDEFATNVLPGLMEGQTEENKAKALGLWSTARMEYAAVPSSHVLDRAGFEKELNRTHQRTAGAFRDVCPGEEAQLALEVLRRKAVRAYNGFIEDNILPIVEKQGAYLGFGDGVWRTFFAGVKTYKAEILGQKDHEMIAYAWEALMLEDVVRTPSVSAPVALYLVLLATVLSRELVTGQLKEVSRHVDEGIGEQVQKAPQELYRLVNPVTKRRFAASAVQALLSNGDSSRQLAKALRAVGHHDLSRDAALCEAMNDSSRLLEADTVPLIGQFSSTAEVKTLLASIMGGKDEPARRHVAATLGIAVEGASSMDDAFAAVDWATNWRRLATALLSDPATLKTVLTLVRNLSAAKGMTKRDIFTDAYAKELEAVSRAREARAVTQKAKIDHVVQTLSSNAQVDQTLELLHALGVDMTALEAEATELEQRLNTVRPAVDAAVLDHVLELIARRHPTWRKANVLPSSSAPLPPPVHISALERMVRMFVRLTYVPQAGAAAIAQHSRRRIGPVGTEPFQHNIPAEVGVVEQYDNLQYKRYDWQGWYQRMVDIHNRNVSIRCRIDDLKRLDGYGNPFVDLQSERRLRILSGDRVGMGVLKLDSDKYEDQTDNYTFGATKLSELLADARKAQLGAEYWPTVEVKVRKPSGQSQAHYSLIDYARIEDRSKDLYSAYRDAKKRSLFVTPMDLWLEVKGMQVRKATDTADEHGYTVDTLQRTLDP